MTTNTIILRGTDPVPVELTWSEGPCRFEVAGIADEVSAREAGTRLRAAIANTLGAPPRGVLLVSPSQPTWPTGLDLPAALAVCGCEGPAFGELGLSGTVRPVRGSWIAGRAMPGAIVPATGALAPGAHVARTLAEALGGGEPAPLPLRSPLPRRGPTLEDAPGLELVVRQILAAWNVGRPALLIGPPGAGKTLATRIAHGMLPALEGTTADRVRAIRDAAGLLFGGAGLTGPLELPFRAPHHTCSRAAMLGGGQGDPRPGECSLAHGGVLYLDELPELSRDVRESLRGVLTDGEVMIVRRGHEIRFPAHFRLVASANPCPCGWHGCVQPSGVGPIGGCQCLPAAVERWQARWALPGVPWVGISVPARRPGEVTR